MSVKGGAVLDAGCGKGRYLKNLIETYPKLTYYGMDLSRAALHSIHNAHIETKQGILTNIPFTDESFDLVYCCEALEHAIDVKTAVRELLRVTKKTGKVIIIDKPIYKLGVMPIEAWEQWINPIELQSIAEAEGRSLREIKNIHYEDEWTPDLFHAWIFQ